MVEPTSNATPYTRSRSPGQTATTSRPDRTATVTPRLPRSSAGCSVGQHGVVDLQPGELPLLRERRAAAVAGRRSRPPSSARPPRRSAGAITGSTGTSSRPASLRTTWRCTWLDSGTSITTSSRICAAHPSRRPRGTADGPCSRAPWSAGQAEPGGIGVHAGARTDLDLAPPADARAPPHTESRSTPRARAASSTVVPAVKCRVGPAGVNETSAVPAPSPACSVTGSGTACSAARAAAAGPRPRRRLVRRRPAPPPRCRVAGCGRSTPCSSGRCR